MPDLDNSDAVRPEDAGDQDAAAEAAAARIAELRQRWEADPSSKVYLQLAEECRKAGRLDEAVEILQTSLEHRPRDPRGRVALARCRLDLGQPAAAAELLEVVARQDPAHVVANKLLLEAYLQLGDVDKAAERLNLYRLLNDRDPELDHFVYRLDRLQDEPASPDEDATERTVEDQMASLTADTAITSSATSEDSAAPEDAPDDQAAAEPNLEPSFAFETVDSPLVEELDPAIELDAVDEPSALSTDDLAIEVTTGDHDAGLDLATAPASPADEDDAPTFGALDTASPVTDTPSFDAMALAADESAIEPDTDSTPPPTATLGGYDDQVASASHDNGARDDAAEAETWPTEDDEPPMETAADPTESTTDDLFDLTPPPAPNLDDLFGLTNLAPAAAPALDALWGGDEGDAGASAPDEPTTVADEPTVTLGQLYLQQGHVDEAEHIFNQILAHDPSHPEALAGLDAVAHAAGVSAENAEPTATPASSPPAPAAEVAEPATDRATEAAISDSGLDAAGLLANPEIDTVPEGLTAKKILVLRQYGQHLRRAADHVQ